MKIHVAGYIRQGSTSHIPRKAHRGGEDSYLVSSPTNSTIAVADGVGGWESKGVNPRAFADEMLIENISIHEKRRNRP